MNPQQIIDTVARITYVPFAEMQGRYRGRAVTEARFMAMYIIRSHCGFTTTKIARLFNRDHSTVIYGLKTTAALLQYDPAFAQSYRQVTDAIAHDDFAPRMLAAARVSPYVLPGLTVFKNQLK